MFATLCMLILASLTVWLTTQHPWLGLSLTLDDNQHTILLNSPKIHSQSQPPTLLALEKDKQPPIYLQDIDILEEPDTLTSYQEIRSFYYRQQLLHQYLDGSPITLVLQDAEKDIIKHRIIPMTTRPLASLPGSFWVQLLAGAGGFLIGIWVWVLRPQDISTQFFALTGTGLMLSAFAAAIYSTRELAIHNQVFEALSFINHLGAAVFGGALLGLFSQFPKPLIKPKKLWLIPLVFLPWLVIGALHGAISPSIDTYLLITTQTLGIFVLLFMQWRQNRGNPINMAALRWLGLSTLLTSGLFIALAAIPALLDIPAGISQGYAFGVFLIPYIGLALGLRHYRLFDLDRWAFHLLLWVIAAAALFLIDLAILSVLHFSQEISMALALLICGFLWLPLRGWLWHKIVNRQPDNQHDDFKQVLQLALTSNIQDRRKLWESFLHSRFSPLNISECQQSSTVPLLQDNGLILVTPAITTLPSLALSHANHGQRLFTPQDVHYMNTILEMLDYADKSREAHSRGANEERIRIARDLHDDIGSRLLTGLRQTELETTRHTIQQAITEMRTIINGLTGKEMLLAEMLAELRHETSLRLEASGLQLDWPVSCAPEEKIHHIHLPYRLYRNYLSVMRELVSNIIRHANASQVSVHIQVTEQLLISTITDNGVGLPDSPDGSRHGLNNLKERLRALGGNISFESPDSTQGTQVKVTLPYKPSGSNPSSAA